MGVRKGRIRSGRGHARRQVETWIGVSGGRWTVGEAARQRARWPGLHGSCLPSMRATQGSVWRVRNTGPSRARMGWDGVVVVCALALSRSQQGPVPSKTEAGWPLRRGQSRTLLPPAGSESVHQMLFLRAGSIHWRQAASTFSRAGLQKPTRARWGKEKSPRAHPVRYTCHRLLRLVPCTHSRNKKQNHSTQDSRVVPHRGTN